MTTAHYKRKTITKVSTGYMVNGIGVLYKSLLAATNDIDAKQV